MSILKGLMSPFTGVMDLHIEFMKVTGTMRNNKRVAKRGHIERK